MKKKKIKKKFCCLYTLGSLMVPLRVPFVGLLCPAVCPMSYFVGQLMCIVLFCRTITVYCPILSDIHLFFVPFFWTLLFFCPTYFIGQLLSFFVGQLMFITLFCRTNTVCFLFCRTITIHCPFVEQ